MKYADFRKKLPSPLFTRQDLRLMGDKVFAYQLSLWQKQGHVIKLKNGLYLLAERNEGFSPEEIASQLYSPSYISLEKALSYYGIIPEMVYGITSVTSKITRKFNNSFGVFTFRHIKPSLFFGYKSINGKNNAYYLAEPEKALLDYLYFNSDTIKTFDDIHELRLNRQRLSNTLQKKQLNKYLKMFNSQKIANICKRLLGD